MDQAIQFTLAGLTTGSIYALIALGFTLTYNASGVVNFAQGEFVLLGGFLAVTLHLTGIPLGLAAMGAVIGTALIAGIVHLLTLSRVPELDTFGLLMVTVGIAIVLRTLMLLTWGSEERALPAFTEGEAVHILGGSMPPQALWVIGSGLVVMPVLYLFFTRTRAGDAMMAASDNRIGARIVGIRTNRVGLYAFMLGAGLAALGGVLIAPITTIGFALGLEFSVKGFTAAVLGGFGSPVGAVVGGLALGLVEKFGAGYISTGYQDLFALATLLLVLMLLPRGIAGSRALEA